jgi:hypothetical protein
VRDGFLEIPGPPPQKKFGVDSYAGWLGYITTDDLLFVKRFPADPDRAYGEVAAYTISIWYNERQMCELEPIGPTETIRPEIAPYSPRTGGCFRGNGPARRA